MEVTSATYQSNTVNTKEKAQATSSKASAHSSKTSNASSTSNAEQTSTTAKTDSYVSSNSTQVNGLYNKPNKLTSDQIQALKDAQNESQVRMLREMAKGLTIGQGGNALVSSSDSFSELLSILNDFAKKNNLPSIATDPTEAKAAISDGGAYSVDAVATRIMDLATSLAGGDSEKLSMLRAAVEKGFESAGTVFSKATGQSKLPSICQDTYKEVMSRFDDLEKKYSASSTDETAKATDNATNESKTSATN